MVLTLFYYTELSPVRNDIIADELVTKLYATMTMFNIRVTGGIAVETQSGLRTECVTKCMEMRECVGFSYKEASPGGVSECHLSFNKCNSNLNTEQGSHYFVKN